MRHFVLGLIAVALAGCVTVSNTLTTDQVASFRLTQVDVVMPADARIRWGDGEAAYASSKGLPPASPATPESERYVRDGVSTRVRAAFQRELTGKLVGARPVKVQVTVRDVDIAPAIQRIVLGGNHSMKGDVAIVDAKTGAVLSSYPAQMSMSQAGQGIGGALIDAAFMGPPIDRVVNGYASQYREWLLRDGMVAPLRS